MTFLLGFAACSRGPTTTCETVADRVESLLRGDPQATEIRVAFAQRCEIDSWSEEMRTCVGSIATAADRKGCRRHLSDAQNARLDRALEAFIPPARGVPESCHAYERALAPLLACQTLPRELRDDLATKLARHRETWTDDADRGVLDTQCRAGLVALEALACP